MWRVEKILIVNPLYTHSAQGPSALRMNLLQK